MNEDNIGDLFCRAEIEIWQTRCLTEHSSDSKTKPEHISILFLVSDFPPNLVDSENFFLFRFVYIIHCSLSTQFRQMFNLTYFFFLTFSFPSAIFHFYRLHFIAFSFFFLSLYFLTFFLHVFIQASIHYLFISPRHWFYFIFLSLFFIVWFIVFLFY